MMKMFLQYINEVSVACANVAFILIIFSHARKQKKLRLEEILVRIMAASAIPTAIALLCCAFYPSLLQEMSGFNIHIATAGLALLFISVKSIASSTWETEREPETNVAVTQEKSDESLSGLRCKPDRNLNNPRL